MNLDAYYLVGAAGAATAAALFGYALGVIRNPAWRERRDENLDFLDAMGYSLQCVNGLWAVTYNGKVVGLPADTIAEAVESAAGWGSEVRNG